MQFMTIRSLVLTLFVGSLCFSMEQENLPGYLACLPKHPFMIALSYFIPDDAHQKLFAHTIEAGDYNWVHFREADRYSKDGSLEVVISYDQQTFPQANATKIAIHSVINNVKKLCTDNIHKVPLRSPIAFLETKSIVASSTLHSENSSTDSYDKNLYIIDLANNCSNKIHVGQRIVDVISSFDDKNLLIGLENGDVICFDTSSWDTVRHYKEHSKMSDAHSAWKRSWLAHHPTEDQFVRYHRNKEGEALLQWWDGKAVEPTHCTKTKAKLTLKSLVYSPDGRYTAYSLYKCDESERIEFIYVVDTSSKRRMQKWRVDDVYWPGEQFNQICFLPDNLMLASITKRRSQETASIELRNIETAELIHTISTQHLGDADLFIRPFNQTLQHSSCQFSIKTFMEGYGSIEEIRNSRNLKKAMLVARALHLQSLASKNEEEQKELEAALTAIINVTWTNAYEH